MWYAQSTAALAPFLLFVLVLFLSQGLKYVAQTGFEADIIDTPDSVLSLRKKEKRTKNPSNTRFLHV